VTVVVGSYQPLPESLMAIIRRANSAKVLKSSTPARLYLYDTLLGWLAGNFQDMQFVIREPTSELASLTHDGLWC
jgi:hypothetical protein